MGQEVDAGDQQHELPQHRHDDGADGVADGDEGHLAGQLDAEEEERGAVDPQGRRGVVHQSGIEEAHEEPGEELDDGPEGDGVDEAGLQKEAEGLPDPGAVPGAVVEAQDGLGPLGDALEGQHGELHHAGEDGHGPHGDVVAVFQEGGIEADGDDALAGLHHEGREAQSHAGEDEPRLEAEGLPL